MSRTALRPTPAPKLSAYRQLLRDPRWQRRRLEVLTRDSWTCQECGTTTKELQVHHKWYVQGKRPWEVPMQALVTLCVGCHGTKRRRRGRTAGTRTKQRGGTR
jgi:5-methylcytosine-specific restriction endonuclease McrA